MFYQQPSRDSSAVFCQTVYSRKKRFGKLFDSVFTGCAEPKDEKMLRFLGCHKLEITDMKTLLETIKKAHLPDKRFGSIHLFARIFINTFVAPVFDGDRFELRKRVLLDFENLEFAHLNNTPTVPFFNYRWLLGKILTECGVCQYTRYIKEIKCNKHYEDIL